MMFLLHSVSFSEDINRLFHRRILFLVLSPQMCLLIITEENERIFKKTPKLVIRESENTFNLYTDPSHCEGGHSRL